MRGIRPAPQFNGALLDERACQHIAQDADHLCRLLNNRQRGRIHLFQRMLMIRTMHNDQRFSQCRRIASISIAVPIARPGRIYRMAPMTAVIDDILDACFDDPVADADRRISYFSARVDSIKGYWK